MTQKQTLDILKTGANVFLTGAAGSGKTHVLREYLSCLKERKIPVGITASTGIAATHMGGVTIHSWTGIGIKDQLSDWDIDAISQREKTASRMQNARVLIIDEISMLHHFQLDMINRVLKYVRNSPDPFGGLQVIVCGDFFQLPPVSRRPRTLDENGMLFFDDDYDAGGKARFAYHARAWREADFTVCYLEENYRQNDPVYLRVLNAIRSSNVTDEIMSILKGKFRRAAPRTVSGVGSSPTIGGGVTAKRTPPPSFLGGEYEVGGGRVHPASEEGSEPTPLTVRGAADAITRLYSHNTNVDIENERELAKLNSPLQKYEMTSRGRKNLVETMKKSCLAPEILKLKVDAKVMFVKNNFEKGYVNGTLGAVKKCNPFEIVVATNRGHVRVERDTWRMMGESDKVLAEIEQYPLRLAWAITIHKSQGMSLDAAEIDLSQSFERGMGYVALSRVRTLEGLSLLGLNDTALQIHEEALKFDVYFKEQSAKAAAELVVLPAEELKSKQIEFLGPDPVIIEKAKIKENSSSKIFSSKVSKVADIESRFEDSDTSIGPKEPKISTLDKTKQMLDSGMKVKDVANERGLKVETIINHLLAIKNTDPSWDITRFRSLIPSDRLEKIVKVFQELGTDQDGPMPLAPVKRKLGAGYSYEEVKIARLFL